MAKTIISKYNSQIRKIIKTKGKCNVPVEKYLTCNSMFFYNYIISQFTSDMKLSNWNTLWNIDHIHPQCIFDANNENELKILYNYKNFRPMYISHNNEKGAKINIDDLCRFRNDIKNIGSDLIDFNEHVFIDNSAMIRDLYTLSWEHPKRKFNKLIISISINIILILVICALLHLRL